MQPTMWAQRLVAPCTFVREQVPAPSQDSLAPGQVLLRVLAGGVCGSDLPYFAGALPRFTPTADGAWYASPPGAPLHEVVGEVLASRDPDLAAGDRVVGWATRLDAMQEHLVIDGADAFAYPAELPPEIAIMLQPLACVIYALEQLPAVAGSSAAVIGQGPIGVLFSHVLKSMGAARVTGVDKIDRSDVASAFGIDEVVHASSDSWARSLSDGGRPDLIVEAVGHQVSTLRDAVDALAVNGQIYYFGIPDDPVYPFPMTTFLRKNARLAAGATLDKRRSLARASEHLKQHPDLAQVYVTNVFDFADAQQAFALAAAPARGRLKVVLTAT